MGEVKLLEGELREKIKCNFGYVVTYKEKKTIFDSNWSDTKTACVSTYVLRCWLDSMCKKVFEAYRVDSFTEYLDSYPDTPIYEFFGIRLEAFQ